MVFLKAVRYRLAPRVCFALLAGTMGTAVAETREPPPAQRWIGPIQPSGIARLLPSPWRKILVVAAGNLAEYSVGAAGTLAAALAIAGRAAVTGTPPPPVDGRRDDEIVAAVRGSTALATRVDAVAIVRVYPAKWDEPRRAVILIHDVQSPSDAPSREAVMVLVWDWAAESIVALPSLPIALLPDTVGLLHPEARTVTGGMPFRGAEATALDPATFYKVLGREDLGESHQRRRRARMGLAITGSLLLTAGIAALLVGAGQGDQGHYDCISGTPGMDCAEYRLVRLSTASFAVGGVLASIGLALTAGAFSFQADPVDARQVMPLVEAHNRALPYPLESPAQPAREPSPHLPNSLQIVPTLKKGGATLSLAGSF